MSVSARNFSLALGLLLAACVTVPEGPSVRALPGTGKGLEQFRADDGYCRQFALQQSGGQSANQNAVDSGVRSAALGTLIGAAAGAAIGGHQGAGVGAGTGLVVGSIAGAEAGERSAYATQQRYDIAYVQCMYEKGERVPVSRSLAVEHSRPVYSPPPPTPNPVNPPPPAAMPPAPPDSGRLFVYPKGGQSEARIAVDRSACANWASTQSGYDPARDTPVDARHGDYRRALAACLEAHGYTVR